MSSTTKDKRRLYYELGYGDWLSGRLREPEGLDREGDRFVSKGNNKAWEWDLENEVYEITKKKHGFNRDDLENLSKEWIFTEDKKASEKLGNELYKKRKLYEKEKDKLEKEKQEFYDTIRKKRYTPDSTLFAAFNPKLKDDVLILDDKSPEKPRYNESLYNKQESELDFKGRKSPNKGLFQGRTDGYKTGGKRKKKTRKKKTRKKKTRKKTRKKKTTIKRGGLSKELQTALDKNTQLVGKMEKVLKRLDLKKRSTGGKRRKKKRTKRR